MVKRGRKANKRFRPYAKDIIRNVEIEGFVEEIKDRGGYLEIHFVPEYNVAGKVSDVARELQLAKDRDKFLDDAADRGDFTPATIRARDRNPDPPELDGDYAQGVFCNLKFVVSDTVVVRPRRRQRA